MGMKKAKKSMKKTGMKKKAMKKRVSIIAHGRMRKSQVWNGRKVKTGGGLKKSDLKKNKNGKLVSKKMSERSSKTKFPKAVMAARKALGIKGFCPVGGKTAKGQALLKKFREFYKK